MKTTITPEIRSKVIEMHKEGFSYAYIGKRLGIGHTTANNIGKKYYAVLNPTSQNQTVKTTDQTIKEMVTEPEHSNSKEFIEGLHKGKKLATLDHIKTLFSILEKSDYTCPLSSEPNVLVFQTLKKTVLKVLEAA